MRGAPGGRASFRYWDYWGTLVHAFDVHAGPHRAPVVGHARSSRRAAPPPPDRGDGWDDLASPGRRRPLRRVPGPDTPTCPCDAELAAVAADCGPGARPPRPSRPAASGCASRLALRAGRDRRHDLGRSRPWRQRQRRVPGLRPPRPWPSCGRWASPPATCPATCTRAPTPGRACPSTGESHAWVEAWLGRLVRLDPTNGSPAGERHVVVARGRDYADVPPLKGIYDGGAAERLAVTVELTRLA